MKEIIKKFGEVGLAEREALIPEFIIRFWVEALYTGKFFWAMSDEKEALKLYGHQEFSHNIPKIHPFRSRPRYNIYEN